MSRASLRNEDNNPFMYLETAKGSTVVGVDASGADDIVKVLTGLTPNLDPTSATGSIQIQTTTPGDIQFRPKGVGQSTFVNGDVEITAGNLEMPNTAVAGIEGVINFNGTRFVHNKGTNNTFVGSAAGNLSTTGDSSVAIGANALNDDTSLTGMTAVGFNALTALSAGIQNTAVGYAALASATDANQNTAVGYQSLTALTSPGIGGGLNAAYGNASLRANTLGRFNTAIGCQALVNMNGNGTTDINNTAVGCEAGSSMTSGAENVLVGALVANSLLTGNANIVIGELAASQFTSNESSNIIIGGRTGTTGDQNTIRIGTSGSGGHQQNKCFLAGVNGTSVTAAGTVVIDASGQLGTSANLPIAVPVTVPNGGTGQTTLTNHGVLVGAGTSAITQLSVGTNGQVLLGSTGADPVFATLTSSDSSITFTTGAGTLSLQTTTGQGITWSVITGDQTAVVNNGYICNKGSALLLALPTTSAVGAVIEVTGINTALGWKVTQAAGQQIFFGTSSSTSGATGFLQSSNIRDSIKMVCVVANLTWNVISSVGNITVS